MNNDFNRLQQARQQYESIPVPSELSARLEQTIAEHPFVEATAPQNEYNIKKAHKKRRPFRPFVSLAAACTLLFFVTVNINPAIAESVNEIPLLSNITRVFTGQSWSAEKDNGNLIVNQPTLDGSNALSQSINAEIEKAVAQQTTAAQQRQNEYHNEFIATGGTEEEWKQHDLRTTIDYQVFTQNEQYLSFVVTSMDNWMASSAQYKYYNIDLQTNKLLTLQDLLGDDYITIANQSIQQQMQQRMSEDENVMFDDFTTIRPDVSFYINNAGNPIIVFEKYEVGPGAMGQPEFEIER